MLSISTLIVFMVIIHILCAILLMSLWLQNRGRYHGTGFWAADMALKAAGLLLIVLRGTVPYWMATVFATALIVTGAIMLYAGIGIFLRMRIRQYHNIILLALYAAAHSYFAFVNPYLSARNLLLSAVWLLICLQCLWLLFFRVRPAFRHLTFNTGLAMALYSLVNFARIIDHFVKPNPMENYLESGLFEAIILISFQVSTILLTYSLSLMVNRRLSMDIILQEEKYSKAFHFSPYAIMLTRLADGKIIEANTGFEDISGYRLSDAIGKTTADLNLFYDNTDRESILDELNKTGFIRDRELKFRGKSGDIIVGLYSAEMISINGRLCIISIISDITERKLAEVERERLIEELGKALSEIKILGGMLPICSSCKKIRNDRGYWQQIELYLSEHSDAEFSHGLCPDCLKRLYPDLADSILKEAE